MEIQRLGQHVTCGTSKVLAFRQSSQLMAFAAGTRRWVGSCIRFSWSSRCGLLPCGLGSNGPRSHGISVEGPGVLSRFFSAFRGSSVALESGNYLSVTELAGFSRTEEGKYTGALQFISGTANPTVPCFRILSDNGEQWAPDCANLDKPLAQKMYKDMVTLQVLDEIFYNAQRQGRFGFYATCTGEEALNIACAAALNDTDAVFPQYREPGVLLWRGFRLEEFADQCVGNYQGHGKGRQMPIHYGSDKLHYFTVSSVLGTQIPHAVGAAYSLKMDKEQRCSVAFFGEGAASEGDFHAAVNFAAVLEVPVLFICRNNGWAISTPPAEQYRGDGIAGRGQAYGVKSIRVDGNDTLAIYSAVKAARQLAVNNNEPILIELMTYRVGHHSTSDDSAKYREIAEIRFWSERRDGVQRFKKWMETKGWWNSAVDDQLRRELRNEVIACLAAADAKPKPPLRDLFSDVYDSVPNNLLEQEDLARKAAQKCPQDFPIDVPL